MISSSHLSKLIVFLIFLNILTFNLINSFIFISLKGGSQNIKLNFSDEIFIEFIVVQNAEKTTSFKRNHKVRDILITSKDPELEIQKELENDNFEQWVDVNTTTSYLRIDFLSAYPGEDLSGQEPFDECAIQEIRFFGKG